MYFAFQWCGCCTQAEDHSPKARIIGARARHEAGVDLRRAAGGNMPHSGFPRTHEWIMAMTRATPGSRRLDIAQWNRTLPE
jgi:hypothetical protein